MDQTIESKVAETILQVKKDFAIGGKTYSVAPPSVATLIMISEAISRLPVFDINSKDAVIQALSVAKDCQPLGEIVALFILGAKKAQQRPWRFFGKTYKDIVAARIISEISPSELHDLVVNLLKTLQVADFFHVTSSLTEINILRPTKEEVMTASGQQSQESQKSTD